MRRTWLSIVSFLFAASFAGGQTPMAGVALCARANPEYLIRAGDDPGHSYGVAQGVCTWTTPWEIAGLKNTQGVGTHVEETNGDTTKARGTFVDTLSNGDKAYYAYEFTAVAGAGGPQIQGHKWELVGGTGKLVGVKASGTCTARAEGADGSMRYDCKGQYTMPK
jgi:hypothetical protein